MVMLDDYKGFAIEVGGNGEFVAHEYGKEKGLEKCMVSVVARSSTLKELKEMLDRVSKQKFSVPVLIETSYGFDKEVSFKEGTVTSLTAKTNYCGQPSFRVQSGKSWSEYNVDSLVKPSGENLALFAVLDEKQKQVRALEKEMFELRKRLTHFTLKELGVETEAKP